MEWICGPHWRLVSHATKAEKRKWERAMRQAEAKGLNKPGRRFAAWRVWERCKSEAIEASAGIGNFAGETMSRTPE
jgi:hypothetical protein